jgi:hypothetical protein
LVFTVFLGAVGALSALSISCVDEMVSPGLVDAIPMLMVSRMVPFS